MWNLFDPLNISESVRYVVFFPNNIFQRKKFAYHIVLIEYTNDQIQKIFSHIFYSFIYTSSFQNWNPCSYNMGRFCKHTTYKMNLVSSERYKMVRKITKLTCGLWMMDVLFISLTILSIYYHIKKVSLVDRENITQ